MVRAGRGGVSVVASVVDVHGATTSRDGSGRILLDGRPVFPVVLSRGPSLGSRTPSGTHALDEVVRAGVTFFKTGPVSGTWTRATIEQAIAWNIAAKARGVYTWVALGDAAVAPHGTDTAGSRSRSSQSFSRGRGRRRSACGRARTSPFSTSCPSAGAALPLTAGSRPAAILSWCAPERALDRGHLWVTVQGPRGVALGHCALRGR